MQIFVDKKYTTNTRSDNLSNVNVFGANGSSLHQMLYLSGRRRRSPTIKSE